MSEISTYEKSKMKKVIIMTFLHNFDFSHNDDFVCHDFDNFKISHDNEDLSHYVLVSNNFDYVYMYIS